MTNNQVYQLTFARVGWGDGAYLKHYNLKFPFYPFYPLNVTILRYNWKKFAVVTSAIAGHDDFVQV